MSKIILVHDLGIDTEDAYYEIPDELFASLDLGRFKFVADIGDLDKTEETDNLGKITECKQVPMPAPDLTIRIY